MSDLIGPGEAGRRLGVSSRTIQRWLRSGKLPAVRIGGRLKVPVASLAAVAAERVTTAVSPLSHSGPDRPRIRRLLVANRGELVVRIARTCRTMGIATLALVTDDQRDAWWPRAADAIVRLPTDYLDGPAIVAAAAEAGADAVHPGYGFLAERPDFAELVIAGGLTWVGPPPSAMRALGDKAAARRLAARVGVPVLPGYDGRGQGDAVLRREAQRVGYPILVKPSAGGGGKGMHVVRAPAELREALAAARREAAAAFGDDRLILERFLDRPRHVEVQVLRDASGSGISLGERDCSLQRRHQKVIEEAPAPGVGPVLRDRLSVAALRLAEAAGYTGVGTAEFLVADDDTFAFLEMNARLQVEHPVTEVVTGVDLVAAQLRVAGGEPLWLDQSDIRVHGHAIEARLYAEDPWNGFLPTVGHALAVRWPSGPGLRVDAGVGQGDEIGIRYDPLLAKLIAAGPDRRTALQRLRLGLAAAQTIGVTTNRGFLEWLTQQPEVMASGARTDTIDTRWHPRAEPEPAEDAWTSAAALLLDPMASGFRINGPRRMAIELAGQARTVSVAMELMPLASHPPGVADTRRTPTAGAPFAWARDPSGGVVLDIDGRAVRATLAAPPTVDSAVRAAHHGAGSTTVTAPMPGIVAGLRVQEGETVEAHQVLLILEAMKMENAVSAPADGVVERVLVRPGQVVHRGDVLIELES